MGQYSTDVEDWLGGRGEIGLTWNPPFLLGLFFSAPLPLPMSLSSSSLTRFELFFFAFFFGSGARFFVLPPRVERIREISAQIALAVIRAAQKAGVDRSPDLRAMSDADVLAFVRERMWNP